MIDDIEAFLWTGNKIQNKFNFMVSPFVTFPNLNVTVAKLTTGANRFKWIPATVEIDGPP